MPTLRTIPTAPMNTCMYEFKILNYYNNMQEQADDS